MIQNKCPSINNERDGTDNDSIILEFLEYEKALENENNNDKDGKNLLKAEDFQISTFQPHQPL